MSEALTVHEGVPETLNISQRACYYTCVACGQRFWQKKSLVRRAARCKGSMISPVSGKSQVCRAWRCRYNDQCPGANVACAICGATKPPEVLPTRPASVSSPAFLANSASSTIPAPDHARQLPANRDRKYHQDSLWAFAERNSVDDTP